MPAPRRASNKPMSVPTYFMTGRGRCMRHRRHDARSPRARTFGHLLRIYYKHSIYKTNYIQRLYTHYAQRERQMHMDMDMGTGMERRLANRLTK